MTTTTETKAVELTATPGGVAVITLNRPEKRNAFSGNTIEQLQDTFATLRAADHVKLVFLRGAGGVFSAGADLQWMKAAADYTEEENKQDALALAHMLRDLYHLPQVTCALVEGAAMGGGCGLVAACDMAVAVKGTKFAFSEARLGLTPATISPYVIQAIGPRAARWLFGTAEVFSTDLALRLGLITEEVEDATALQKAMSRIEEQVALCAPGAIADAKDLVDTVCFAPFDDRLLEETAKRIAHRRATDEGREGIAAFLGKRKASWV